MSGTEPQPDDLIAGRYRVVRELGRGGMGTVYEAENLRTQRRVALKAMRAEAARRGEMLVRFEREARAAGRTRHPNIVDVLDMGDDAERGLTFIVHELLEGGDLARCLRAAGPLPPRVALATLLPIADALAAAHARGVVHRDVTPGNVFLHEAADGVVPKLIDFGLAKVVHGGADPERTDPGEVLGSPSYVSPEQARGDHDLDARTDVWSLGMVFYKCLCASVAYAAPTTSMLLAKIIYEEPRALAALAPQLPADLVAVVQRAVTKDRAQRWASMADFAEALRGCEAWRGVDATQARGWVANVRGETAVAPPAASVVAPVEGPRAPARSARLVWPAALVTTALVVVAALWPGRAPRAATLGTRIPAAVEAPAAPAVAASIATSPPVIAATAPVARTAQPRPPHRVVATVRRAQRPSLPPPVPPPVRGFNGSPIID